MKQQRRSLAMPAIAVVALLALSALPYSTLAADERVYSQSGTGDEYVADAGTVQWEPSDLTFEADGVTYTYPGRTGTAHAFPVNGEHAHTEYCGGANGFAPNYASGQYPVGSADVSALEVGAPWAEVSSTGAPGCSTEKDRATPRELSNSLHGMTQQAHATVNHVTSASLQTMAHDVGIGNKLSVQFAYGPLMVLESTSDSLDKIIFFGGSAFTTLPGRTVDETMDALYEAIGAKFGSAHFRTPISSSDDIFNAFQLALGEPGPPADANETTIQAFIDFGMSAVAIDPLLSCGNFNSTKLTSEGHEHTVYAVESFDNLCDDRRHVNDVSPSLDASFVYGSDLRTAEALRERAEDGSLTCKLKTHENSDGSTSLPTISDLETDEEKAFFRQVTDTFHRCRFTDFTKPSEREGCRDEDLIIAGDTRAAENFYLAAIQTVLMRKHNQWCDEFDQNASHIAHNWSEDHKYHEARLRTMAVYQHAFVLSSIDFAGLVALGQDRPGSGYEGDEGIAGREVYEVFVPDMAQWEAEGKLISEEHDECEEAVACGVSITNWLDRFQQWPECQDVMTNLMLRWHPALYDEMAVIHGNDWSHGEEDAESCFTGFDGLEEEEEEEEDEGPKLIDIEEGINTIIAQPDINQLIKAPGGLANFLRSAISTHANGNVGFPQSMRNMLFGPNAVIDLAALNIARFRERGVVTVWDALSYFYPEDFPADASVETKEALTWEDLHLDPRVEPHFRAQFCHPWQAEAYSVTISQKQDGFVLAYEDPDFGIFPGDNEGMGFGSVAMARYLSGARNYAGFLERFWLLERLEGDYPQEVKEEALAFYNSIAVDAGFEDSIRTLFIETVPEFQGENHCMPNNIWHTPLSSDFMTASGKRAEECDCLTTRFRVLHEASPCFNASDAIFLEEFGIGVPSTTEWSTDQTAIIGAIAGYAGVMTIAAIVMGAILIMKKSKKCPMSASRVQSIEKPLNIEEIK